MPFTGCELNYGNQGGAILSQDNSLVGVLGLGIEKSLEDQLYRRGLIAEKIEKIEIFLSLSSYISGQLSAPQITAQIVMMTISINKWSMLCWARGSVRSPKCSFNVAIVD